VLANVAGAALVAGQAGVLAAGQAGVTGTPAWLVDEKLLIPGAQPREVIERWVTRMLERGS